jgi:hypothetical protein
MNAVQPRHRIGIAFGQRPGDLADFGPAFERAAALPGRERKPLDTRIMQKRAGRPCPAPQIGDRTEIETGPEPGLADREGLPPGPGFRKAVAREKDVAGLGETVLGGEIDVAEPLRERERSVLPAQILGYGQALLVRRAARPVSFRAPRLRTS